VWCRCPIVAVMPHTEHMPVAEAAELLGESRWTTQRRIRSGQLRAKRVANLYLIDRAEIDRLLSERQS
jgi:excisionase family DNA binding protein